MAKPPSIERRGLRRALETHAQTCEHCDSEPIDLATAESVLHALAVDAPGQASIATLMPMAQIELARNAARAQRRKIAAAVGLAMLPLPLIGFYGVAVVSFVGSAATTLLPGGLATYVKAAYTASVVLVYALTYAALPLLLERVEFDNDKTRSLQHHGVPS